MGLDVRAERRSLPRHGAPVILRIVALAITTETARPRVIHVGEQDRDDVVAGVGEEFGLVVSWDWREKADEGAPVHELPNA